jgi:hypothetical protein
MCEHKTKYCPHCNQLFDCKVGSILLCQCTTVSLTENERLFMKHRYEDCLCTSCMKQLKDMYADEKLNDQIAQLVNSI